MSFFKPCKTPVKPYKTQTNQYNLFEPIQNLVKPNKTQ